MNKVQFLIASDVETNVKSSIVEMLNAQEVLTDFEIVEDFDLSNTERLKQISNMTEYTPIVVGIPKTERIMSFIDRIHPDIILAHPPIKLEKMPIHMHHDLLEDPSIVLGDIHHKLDGMTDRMIPHDDLLFHAHRYYLEDFNIDVLEDNLNGHANMDRKMHLSDNIYGGSISHNMSRWENKKSQKTMIIKRRKKK